MKRLYLNMLIALLAVTSVAFATESKDMRWFRTDAEKSEVTDQNPQPRRIIERSSVIKASGVRTQDSPDIAIIGASNTTQSENSIFMDPNNPLVLLNSNNSSNWPAPNTSDILGADHFVSVDGGLTWTGSIQPVAGANYGDPATAIDQSGRMYVGYIANNWGQGVAWSANQGVSWTHVQVGPGTAGYPDMLDKNHLWVDNSGATTPGNLYSAWTNFVGSSSALYEIEIVRSIDAGVNWTAPVVISSSLTSALLNHGVNIQTGPNGEVYVVWAVYDNASPLNETALGFASSFNGGGSWTPAARIITNIRGHREVPLGGGKTMRHNSLPSMTVNQQTGEIFVVWTNTGVPGTNTGDPDIYMISSTDNGANWSVPVRVNQDVVGNGTDQYFPWICCDRTTGLLSCIFYDSRNSMPANDMVETFVALSWDDGQTWLDVRVSDVAWSGDEIVAPAFASGYAGDYLGITSDKCKVIPCWSDDRTGNMLAYISPFDACDPNTQYDVWHTLQVPVGLSTAFEVVVKDQPSGLPVQGASVTLTGPGVNRSGITDANGEYTAVGVSPISTGLICVTVVEDFLPYVSYAKACLGYEDVIIRDHPDDDGRVPSWDANHNGWQEKIPPDRAPWESPDIWVNPYPTIPPKPWEPFNIWLGDAVVGQKNHLYVRAWNIGTADAIGCDVSAYYTDFGINLGKTLIPPTLVGVDVPLVPQPWTHIFDWTPLYAGHFCVFVEMDCPTDPIVVHDAPWDNNIGWRNVTIVSKKKSLPSDSMYRVDDVFRIGNQDPLVAADMELELSTEGFPADWIVQLMPVPAPNTDFVQVGPSTYIFHNIEPGGTREVAISVETENCLDSGLVRIAGNIDNDLKGGVSYQVVPPVCPIIKIEKTHNTYQGQHEYVSITTESAIFEMGGFDFLVAYDASALVAMAVTPGQLLLDCGWEYFTYRHGPFGNCGDACPSGLIRIFALAETNNGPNHPSCFGPSDCDEYELVAMDYLVTNDRTFEGQYVPIRFFWTDCGDNTFSSADGDVLFVSDHVYDFEGTEITDSTYGFPTYFGVQMECLGNDDPEKPDPIRCPTFVNGGIDIIPAEDIDDRGDINLNGVVNEVADAVLFSNYFVHGISVFNVNIDGQIAASDVNADGITLSVADLVYMIRIITGDALPYPKLTAMTANADLVNGVLSVDGEMGAAYVVVENSVTPLLLVESMEMKYQYDADHDLTRILVYSLEKDQRFSGDFLGGIDGNVITLEMATYEGAPVTTKLVPDEFALYPSYPNPFNPITTISFALASVVDYELVIYNALGQTVETFTGHSGPGLERIDWNASGFASGVYFYRLTAGDFTDTKKMVLLK